MTYKDYMGYRELEMRDADIARVSGESYQEIRRMRKRLKLPVLWDKPFSQHPVYYIYDRRTTQMLAFGSARECADALGLTVHTIHTIASRSRRGVVQKYEVVVEHGAKEEET